ncbi:hypothetical protein Agabi119p4_10468 [Agaricus bisporus var. burnettii]|uniref:Uncharacterized protein n=1 Tax=Agaricus bisporus var. burnettii TaxID=192524 RepID=A0A8H7C3P8_AGABI|nr:hypothetical protein Agabi119p4_10468 [Agaricus bisporus var. burnettii]
MNQARLLPPPLQIEEPLAVDEIIRQIDPWIFYHLRSTIGHVHYENQLYGIINAFLTSIFPLRRRFMTIPQYMLRRALELEEIDEYLANVSFGSTDCFFESRDLAGNEEFKLYPDFAIVKVTPQPNSPREHRLIALIEVKRDEKAVSTAMTQCFQYLEQAQGHLSRREDLCCYLMLGSRINVIAGSATGHEEVETFDMFDCDDQFTRALCTIAREEWNS